MRFKSIIPLGLAASLLFQATAFAAFSDVSSSHPYSEAILHLQNAGVIEGYPPEYYFYPDQQINRAEFVKVLTVGLNLNQPAPTPLGTCTAEEIFPDVSRTAWYVSFTCTARRLGFIQGYPDGRFHGERSINFVEAAKILSKAFSLSIHADEKIWYKGYVRALAEKSAIPLSISSFDQNITRGEMAEIIYRLYSNIENKSSATYQELATRKNEGWKTFNSKYFRLSFNVPKEFNVEEGENSIWISAPQPPPEPYGTIYNFFQIDRYVGTETKITEIEDAQESLKNIVQDSIVIDGNSFVRIIGNNFSTINGKIEIIPNKITYIFFEKSKVVIYSGFPELVSGYDSLILGNQIILTMKFSSTER